VWVAITLALSLVLPSFGTVEAAPSLHFLYGSGSQTGGKNIQLRVELTEPAPIGGTEVTLTSNDVAIPLPSSVTVPAGEIDHQFAVTTNPVTSDRAVIVSAALNGVLKSRSVLIKAPVLTSIGLQTVIRHEGQGKVIIRLSGPAASGGLDVDVDVDPWVLDLPDTITVPEGVQSLSLKPDADMFGTSALALDQPFTLTVSEGPRSFSKSALVRMFPSEPNPTATPSNTPSATASATSTATVAAPTATATATIAAATATASATATATLVPATATATATATSSTVPTATNTVVPTATETIVPTNTSTVAPTSTETAGPTATPSNTPEPTATVDPTLSEACVQLNSPVFDGQYGGSSISSFLFDVGDEITWTFTGETATVEIFQSETFEIYAGPANNSTSFLLTSPGTYLFEWDTVTGNVTWEITCTSDNPV
jgi:hypothetical protein